MANTKDTDIVKLRIDAENLAIDEITQTVDGLGDLGAASRKAEQDLKNLELSQDTINSYRLAKEERARLRKEFDLAEVAYEKLAKAVKENKNATDEEILSVKTAKRELADLGKVLRSQDTEYNRLSRTLKQYGVDTKDLDKTQQKLQTQIKETSAESSRLTAEYQKQITAVRQRIDVEKQAVLAAKEAEAAEKERQAVLDKTAAEQEKLVESSRKLAAADAARISSQAKLNQSLNEYEASLRDLNAEVDDGTLSTADYIREEERLRKSLELTEGQVKTIRNALRAEIDDRKKVERALESQAATQRKLTEQQQAAVAAERAAAVELNRVQASVKEYEIALEKLNREKTEGVISTGQYIRSENELRRSLQLTEAQVKLTRRAIESDAVTRTTGAKNTDLLTQATRRLAQAYTVLLAAQKATQAVSASVTEYGQLEAAVTKVEKTTGTARLEIEGLAETLSDMAQNITPTATTELLRYAEVAGQLGTKSTGDLLNLVAAADALQNSTNLSGDQAVELLARILTMTGEGIPAIQNLSSSVVALGNDFAASEADIVQMTKEIVAGTREIELSAGAAAAIGVTLAELGQPAERSRTAIQRLAGVIKEATVKGGEDMERLSLITKMTGEEIIKSFGEEPEKILLAFLKGLDDINDSGGQMSTVLAQMGIEGTEALTVLGTLAGRTDRLETALKLSNEQWVAGNAHMKEAAKAYANQESALGRLDNKFGALKKAIGEAFSDETETAIRVVGDIIDETGNDVVRLMEQLPQLVSGLTEAVQVLDNLTNTFSNDDSGLNALDNILGSIAVSGNTVTTVLNTMILGLQGGLLATLELNNAIKELAGIKVSLNGVEAVKKAMLETKQAIDRDVDDINKAFKRMDGESSLAFEGLIDASVKYKDAMGQLNAEQRAAISAIVSKNEYSETEEGQYRKLTAALVRANREMEIEAELRKSANDIAAQTAISKEQEIGSIEQLVNAQVGLNISMTEYLEKAAVVEESIARVKELRRQGVASEQEAAVAIQALSDSMAQYNIVATEQSDVIQKNNDNLTIGATTREELFEQYQRGSIAQDVFEQSLAKLNAGYERANILAPIYSSSVEVTTLAQAKFADEILKTQKAIDDYNGKLKAGNLILPDRQRLMAALAVEEEKLKRLRDEQSRTIEIENANYQQLTQLQRQYQQELTAITAAFERGALTKAEYENKTRSLTEALNEINGVIRENTSATEENTAATEKNVDAQNNRAAAAQKASTAVSLELENQKHLNKAYDFTNKTTAELNKRNDELSGKLIQLQGNLFGFWQNLANTSREIFSQEQAVIRDTLAMREMQAELDKGSLSMGRLSKISSYANSQLTALSEQQLSPLLQAIAKAKQELQELSDTVDDSLLSVQDRLDKALGKEQDIVKRKFKNELDEYLELMDKARKSGDSALVSRVDEAIRKLKQAQEIEFKQQFEKPATQPTTTTPTTAGTDPSGYTAPSATTSQSGGEMVVFQLQVGDTKYNAQMDQSSLNTLVANIQRSSRLGG